MPIRLPAAASELTDAAYAEVERESKQVETEMMGSILPRSIRVILKFDEEAQKAEKSFPWIESNELIETIAQTLWSYPGSYGAMRIKSALKQEGLGDAEAESISQTIFNLTRYPLSIVNYMRHMRSAINSIGNVFYGPKAPESLISELGISTSQMKSWIASSNELRSAKIQNEKEFRSWLSEVEIHLKTFSPIQARINRALSGRPMNPTNREAPGIFESSAARAYVRRFGNYVAAHAKFKDFEKSAQGKGSTISDEFAELRSVYEGSEKSIYETLKADYDVRARRLSASVSKNFRPMTQFEKGSSPYQNLIEQLLNLNGKNVKIKTSSATLPEALIRQFIKSLYLQFDINSDQKALNSRLNAGSDSIEVQIESPTKADLKKVQAFIESMYLN